MSDHGTQSDFEKADEVPTAAIVESSSSKLLLVLSNTVVMPTEYVEAQPPNRKPFSLPRYLERHTFDISASSAPGAERGTVSAALQTYRGWMLQRIIDRM